MLHPQLLSLIGTGCFHGLHGLAHYVAAQITQLCTGHLQRCLALECRADRRYARASYASGGGGASRVPRIAGDVTAGSALVSCVLVSYAPCAGRRRFDLPGRGWPPGTALWGFNSVAGSSGPVYGAAAAARGLAVQQREAVSVLP